MIEVQNDLGYQGYAPVASLDTQNAERHRLDYINSQQQAAQKLV